VISLYARGLSVREIQAHLQELYGVEVSPDLISRVTDAVLDEVREWQNRPLDPVYPVVFFDALRVKIRDEGLVRNKAVYVALALNGQGEKEVLGLWIEQTEGAKFWLKVMNELKARGVNDLLIAVVDGLKGFPEAIATVFPLTTVQTCIIHLIRNSLAFVSWKDRKRIMPDLKAVYRAETAEATAEGHVQASLDRLGTSPGAWIARASREDPWTGRGGTAARRAPSPRGRTR
jgi:putative transposase